MDNVATGKSKLYRPSAPIAILYSTSAATSTPYLRHSTVYTYQLTGAYFCVRSSEDRSAPRPSVSSVIKHRTAMPSRPIYLAFACGA